MDAADSPVSHNRLRQERLKRQWRQRDVADQLGATVVTVSRWESGLRQPSAYFQLKLCTLFGKSAEELGLVEEHPELPPAPIKEEAAESAPALVSSSNELALWTVPYLRNPHFTGRDEVLARLDQQLFSERPDEPTTARRAALTQPQAVKGLGGIGKTQIAVEYAYRAAEQGRYTHTIWINAASQEAIMTSFVGLAERLPAFPAREETNQRKLVAAIKRWLEQCQERWLLIFDNADDVSLAQEYFPQQGHGSILLTTRANAVAAVAASIDVEQMGMMEGTQLLLHRAQRLDAADEERNEAANIVIALDGFPLALDQAGAYIEETGCSFVDYLQLYHAHRREMLARRGVQATHYPDSVATTWFLSFQTVERASPAAAEFLRLCAFLAPDRIPEELFKEGAAYWPPVLQQAASDLFTFNQMLEALLRFSLVKRLTADRLLSIHRLVQAVIVDTMEAEEQRQWAERVVRAVNIVFPQDPKDAIATWPQCLRYLEQAQACDTLIQQHLLLLPEAADLLERAGIYLRMHASYTLAEPLFQRALCIREQQMGLEHPLVAHALNNLAELYREQGKYPEAEGLYQRALCIAEQPSGSEPLLRGTVLNGLASVYYSQGKFAEAEPLYQRALRIAEQLWGPEHPRVAITLNNLAGILPMQGKYAEAELLYKRVLRIWEQQAEPEHLRVGYPLNGLGTAYREQGKYAEAEAAYQKAIRIWERQLGPEHPLVTYPLNNLAILYQAQGRYAESETLHLRTIRIREQHLGPEHPDIAVPLQGLADLYRMQGRYPEAERLYQRALAIREQALDSRHPYIADTLYSFAAFREAQGNIPEAASLYRRALAIREQVLGSEHPHTIATRERLHAVLAALEQPKEAVPVQANDA